MKLVYIGNALSSRGSTPTAADTLPGLFRKEGYDVAVASSRKNMIVRMLDMLLCIFRNVSAARVVFIDTYSTKNFWFAYLCAQLCRILGLPYIPVLHGGDFPTRMEKSPRMTEVLLKQSSLNITPSRYLLEALESRGYEARLVANTIPIHDCPFKERKSFRPRLLYVRALAEIYNPKMALRVLAEILKDYPGAELCMIGPDGDGSLQGCIELSRELGIESKVKFAGKLPKEEWHHNSEGYDIFINTTNKDNTPVSVIEAMALGLPVISTNPGGIPYLIEDGVDGLLVETNDVHGMANKIRSLLVDVEYAIEMAVSARRKAESFDWETVKILWKEIIDLHEIKLDAGRVKSN